MSKTIELLGNMDKVKDYKLKEFNINTTTKRILNKYKTYEERTSFIFVGYFELYIKHNLSIRVDNCKDFFFLVEDFIENLKMFGNEYHERVLKNFNTLGYETIKKLYKKDDNEIVSIVNSIIFSDITIENLIDMFEVLSPSDKSLNDFFTPPDISKLLSKILIDGIDDKKEEIVIYDPTCGVGRLLYYTLLSIKERYPNKKVVCIGCDIFPKYSVFTQSILDLINHNNNCTYIGNSLFLSLKDKPDLVIGNPPFGEMSEQDYKKYIQFQRYIDPKSENLFPKKYKDLPPLTEEEFKSLTNFKRV